MAQRILDREHLFMIRRAEARQAFKNIKELDLDNLFKTISRQRPEISMTELIWFSEKYGFQFALEDLEAILRRCDHDADRCLSYPEFIELIGRDYDEIME